jgi:hypothetical protein
LLHLDLSHNKFSAEDTKIISLKIENNHILFGFHYRGNGHNKVDHKGFLLCEDKQKVSKDIRGEILLEKNKKIKDIVMNDVFISKRINGVKCVADLNLLPENL